MAHVPLPPITPRTGLWGLGFRMDVISNHLYNLSQDIEGAWIVGKWFAYPFYILSLYFAIARDKCWEADQSLVHAITWVNGLVEGSIIADILEKIWFEFTFLRYDPIGWVRQKIDEISGELQFLRNDPYGWIRSRLYLALPVFYSLLGNSGWWIYDKLSNRYPVFRNFIDDTWGFIRNYVTNIFWWVRPLDSDSIGFVIDRITQYVHWFREFLNDPVGFVYSRAMYYRGHIHTLFTDPVRWIKDRLAIVLGMSSYELDTFIPSLIKRAFGSVLSNEGGLLDYVSEAMVNLILRFI